MSASLSPNTQAIFLLTAPLLLGRNSPPAELLSHNEYKQLARHLREGGHQPCDLLNYHADDLLRTCQPIIDENRLRQLLARGFLLSQAVTHWHSRAIWVVSRADQHYPARLKTRLREDAPAVLYGCGDISLLNAGGLAVVGSRDADQAELDYARHAGKLSAQAEKVLISGGARGIDQAAMQGAASAQGWVCEVMAEKLERAALDHHRRAALMENRLVLVSAFDPNAGFNVGHAMQRNKHIYALADAALVVASDYNRGGTWAGAVEQLDKMNLVPVYIRSSGNAAKGLHALQQKGALPWPEPQDGPALHTLLHALLNAPQTKELAKNTALPLFLEHGTPGQSSKNSNNNPAEVLFSVVREILQELLVVPMSETTIANALNISQAQAQTWLQRLVDEGTLTHDQRTSPYGYALKKVPAIEGGL
jgi:predicted Rossmann fold nucleotide-binding protein DprA/Smf involved in DNA uptake